MATTKHTAYVQSAASALTTELNSLANATASAASGVIDNTSDLALFMDLELVIAAQGSARSTGASILVFMVHAIDGTNYGDVHETTAEPVAMFPLDAATTARRSAARDIPIPPGLFKLFLLNNTGQALAASGSTLKYRTHNIATA